MSFTDNVHHDVYPAIDPSGALAGTCAGKTVLVTGAGRGIGKGIALAFALAGARTIVLAARSVSELAEARAEIATHAPDTLLVTHATDVTDESSVAGLFERLKNEGVVVDVLVNNAGTMEHGALVHEVPPAEWWRTWEVNIKGTHLPTHFLLKERYAADAPPNDEPITIICLSSICAVATFPNFSAYGPCKTAVNRFVEFLHAGYANKQPRVRAFAIHPGGVLTQLALEVMPPDRHHIFIDQPLQAGGVCVWLAGQPAADALCGRYVSCNWDIGAVQKAAGQNAEDGEWLMMKLKV